MASLPADHFVKLQQVVPVVHRDLYPAIDPKQSSLSQKGKVVIITGASKGLGAQSFAPSFAAAGAKAIVLVARNAEKLEEVAKSVSTSYPDVETLSVAIDVSDPKSVAELYEKIKEKYGHADVLVNNAGVYVDGSVKDVDHTKWWDGMALNIRGTFLMTQFFLKALPSPSTPAKIITLTSGAGVIIFPELSGYGISKLADLQLMTYVAIENPNVVAVALHPGIVKTDMTTDMFQPFAEDTPELVGGTAVWLAGWEGVDRSFLSGRYVAVNWDVDELVKKKEEIERDGLLKMNLKGSFGAEQFEK